MTRNVFLDPCWREADLGKPLPDSTHACSVCLPTWQSNIDYEEGVEAVVAKLEAGYPRFVINPIVRELHQQMLDMHGHPGEVRALAFCDPSAAARCAAFVEQETGRDDLVRIDGCSVFLAADAVGAAVYYWRYAGDGISSRSAKVLMDGGVLSDYAADGESARAEIRERIAAEYDGVAPDDVYLFPSGMAAIAGAHRVLQSLMPGGRFVQVDFPYVDALRVQRHFGARLSEFLHIDRDGAPSVAFGECFGNGDIAGVFVECPSNPLLRCVDLAELAQEAGRRDIPVVVDDTVSSSRNVDVIGHADMVSTSLTKWWSGSGDVMAGSIVLNPRGKHYERLKRAMDAARLPELCAPDALHLAPLTEGYAKRVAAASDNAKALVEWLRDQPEVARVWHPLTETANHYEAIRRADGGWGALFSLTFHGGEESSARFFDALELNKGPSLGTNFTLVCPYVLLAHYDELDWAAELGAPRDLVRVSVGCEPIDELIAKFERALAAIHRAA
ncbi:PLP-dependent transferase [Sulfuriroseicoccus oceanibius]|uniref:PLP-dependent transferase n=1 Tax=Sulfuriroseicoccus oceanibius TaxID=2707525 RepID=A0A6B3LB61_9BACT|nr:PLP-dependent transferase [Sulfuriroseicoccus oceanibius]QQL43971.1 PLP-dependent transferase [Sulfuriroseicoccus oceanibius]